jgi:hypothetical protein
MEGTRTGANQALPHSGGDQGVQQPQKGCVRNPALGREWASCNVGGVFGALDWLWLSIFALNLASNAARRLLWRSQWGAAQPLSDLIYEQ